MREALLIGFIALAFGLGAQQLQSEVSAFAAIHLAVAAAALSTAAVLALLRARRAKTSNAAARAVIVRGLATILATTLVATGATLLAQRAGLSSFE